jgi:hypothetical protein
MALLKNVYWHFQDIDGLQFWLRDMAVVERNARWQKAARQMHGDSKRGPGSEWQSWRKNILFNLTKFEIFLIFIFECRIALEIAIPITRFDGI